MRVITYSQAINEAVKEEMARDETVFIMGEDVGRHGGAFGVTRGLVELYGEDRVRDTPLSEAAIAGAAVGAAMTGMKPIAEIMYIDFITIALDQIINQAAKVRYMFGGKCEVPAVFRTQGGAGRGNAAQHSQSLESWLAHIPGLKVVMPSVPYDAKGLLKAAIRDPNPIVYIENKVLYSKKGEVPDSEYLVEIGKADVKREGCDVTIVSYSRMVLEALAAAEDLSKEGIEAEVVDIRTLRPLDIDTIAASVKKTGRAIVVEEDCKTCGFGAEVVASIYEHAFDYLDAPVLRIAGEDVPIPYNGKLEALAIPSADVIKKRTLEMVG